MAETYKEPKRTLSQTAKEHVAKAKEFGKKLVEYPEDPIPVISTKDWIRDVTKDPLQQCIDYVVSLFPILGWIHRYNLGWAYGDLVAGLTVGIVAVPQSMSYAQIATLPPEIGLYSSFVGVLVYVFFATSKDVSIGPVAVMSLTVSQIIKHVNDSHPGEWSSPEIATTVAFICGFIVLGIGLLRLGWLVEFIPAPAVSGFMTGSAISIVAGQVAGLMGESGFSTRAATYRVIIDSFKFLPTTKLDAAFGLSGLVSLYIIRFACEFLSKRYPRRARFFFFFAVFRNALIIVVLTLASWLYCRHRKLPDGKYPIKILMSVPRGFQHLKQPTIDPKLIGALASELPVATIILFLEHIAISKSFGRVNNYKINPNQELIAIGVTNTIGTIFGAYPATGSFSRSALQSKSGCRTPASGLFSALVVIVALYGLTPAFFWIPNAALCAVIIHAVADLVASPAQVYSYWRISPLEFFIWFAAVIITIFATIEDGIYFSIGASLLLLLIRVARPRGNFLGKLTIHNEDDSREVFVPFQTSDHLINPHLNVYPPAPGVIIYRYEESFLYPNCSLLNDHIIDYVKGYTRRGRDMSNVKKGDRPWNDTGAKKTNIDEASKPLLRAIVFDFSAISHVDTTSIQALLDTRNEVERWVDGPVEFHFASILSPWIRRSLVAAGFGVAKGDSSATMHHHEVAPVSRFHDEYIADPAHTEKETAIQHFEDANRVDDPEAIIVEERPTSSESSFTATYDEAEQQIEEDAAGRAHLVHRATPYFHFDLTAAVRAAEMSVRRCDTNTTYNTFSQETKKPQ